MRKLIVITIFNVLISTNIFTSQVFAQATEVPVVEENPSLPTPETPASAEKQSYWQKAVSAVKSVAPVANAREEKTYLASFNYSAIDFPLPSKWGASVGWIAAPQRTWELEYLSGSYSIPGGFRDLGKVSDTRISLIGRRYFGNSFHWSYGISYFDFSADVGDQLISTATGGAYPSMNALTVQGFGANVGLGSTWTFRKNITVGIDWITLAQPVYVTKKESDFTKTSSDQSANQSVTDTMKVISYLPRFSVLGAHLGMVF